MLPSDDSTIHRGDFPIGRADWSPFRQVFLRDDIFASNHLYVGNRGSGTTELMAHIIQRALQKKANGEFQRPIVVVDLYGDLTDSLLPHIQDVLVRKLRLFDFRAGSKPLINITDGSFFRNSDSLADALTHLCRAIWTDTWPKGESNTMGMMAATIHNYNLAFGGGPTERLNILDCLQMLDDSNFRFRVLGKVTDVYLHRWWHDCMEPNSFISVTDEIAWLVKQIMDIETRKVFDRPTSDISMEDVMDERQVTFITASDVKTGGETSSIIGSLIINGILARLSDWQSTHLGQKENPQAPLLAIDGMEKVPGVDFKNLPWVLVKQSGALVMSATDVTTQDYRRDDGREFRVSDEVTDRCEFYALFRTDGDQAERIKRIIHLPRISIEDITRQSSRQCLLQMVGIDPPRNIRPFSLKVDEIPGGDPSMEGDIHFLSGAYVNPNRLRLAPLTAERKLAIDNALSRYID